MVSNEEILHLLVQVALLHGLAATTVLKIFVNMLISELQSFLMFLLKENIVFAVASSLTRALVLKCFHQSLCC
jgi:hypothetical protein